jgi:hypothetical protein
VAAVYLAISLDGRLILRGTHFVVILASRRRVVAPLCRHACRASGAGYTRSRTNYGRYQYVARTTVRRYPQSYHHPNSRWRKLYRGRQRLHRVRARWGCPDRTIHRRAERRETFLESTSKVVTSSLSQIRLHYSFSTCLSYRFSPPGIERKRGASVLGFGVLFVRDPGVGKGDIIVLRIHSIREL